MPHLTRLLPLLALVFALPFLAACQPFESAQSLSEAGARLAAEGKADEAQELLDRAIRLDSAYVAAYRERAALRRNAGDLAGAQEDLTAALTLEPGHVATLIARADVLRRQGKLDGAVADLDAAVEADAGATTALHVRAFFYANHDDSERALDDYQAILKLEPGDALALSRRAMSTVQTRGVAQALRDLEHDAQGASPAAILTARGDIYRVDRDCGEAVKLYAQAIELDAASADAFFGRGLCWSSRDREQALDDFLQATKVRPEWADAHYQLAMMQLSEGRSADARASMDEAVALDRGSADAIAGRAFLAQSEKRFQAAVDDYELALRMDAEQPYAREQIQEILTEAVNLTTDDIGGRVGGSELRTMFEAVFGKPDGETVWTDYAFAPSDCDERAEAKVVAFSQDVNIELSQYETVFQLSLLMPSAAEAEAFAAKISEVLATCSSQRGLGAYTMMLSVPENSVELDFPSYTELSGGLFTEPLISQWAVLHSERIVKVEAYSYVPTYVDRYPVKEIKSLVERSRAKLDAFYAQR